MEKYEVKRVIRTYPEVYTSVSQRGSRFTCWNSRIEDLLILWRYISCLTFHTRYGIKRKLRNCREKQRLAFFPFFPCEFLDYGSPCNRFLWCRERRTKKNEKKEGKKDSLLNSRTQKINWSFVEISIKSFDSANNIHWNEIKTILNQLKVAKILFYDLRLNFYPSPWNFEKLTNNKKFFLLLSI